MYQTVTLSGTYRLPDGSPAKGPVEIIPSEKVIIDSTGDVILSGRVKVQLDETGSFSVALPATDDPTLNPTGFGYTVSAKLHHQTIPAVSFSLPAALGTVDIADLTFVDPSTFTPGVTYVSSTELDAVEARVLTLEETPAVSSWDDLTDKPTLAPVATSGTYADLTDKPTIPGPGPAFVLPATEGTADLTPLLNAAVTDGHRHIVVPYRTAAWPMLSTFTATGITLEFEPGARVSIDHAGRAMDLTRCALLGASLTSIYTGPVTAADATSPTYGHVGEAYARELRLNDDCVVDGYFQEYATRGLQIVGQRVTYRNVTCRNIRHQQGWGAAIHISADGSVGHDIFVQDSDRAFEMEEGSSYNLVEGAQVERIGPNGYAGQGSAAAYANYTAVFDVHAHAGEGSSRSNVYRNVKAIDCQGAITCSRASGSSDTDMPRDNLWENVTIQGRVGTTGNDTIHLHGHGNKVRGVKLQLGSGITSRMRAYIDNGSTGCEIEIVEAAAYAAPLVKVGTSVDGRGNKVSVKRVSPPTTGSTDWLIDVHHPASEITLDIKDVTGTFGYTRLNANAHGSRIKGYYAVAAGTAGMSQALRIAGPRDADIDVVASAGAVGVLDVNATASTQGLTIKAQVERASGTSISLDSTTTACKIATGTSLGGGTIVNAGAHNRWGDSPLLAGPNATGKYMTLGGQATSTNSGLGNNSLRLVPVYVGSPITIDRVGAEITAAGNAGAVVRLAIYNDAQGFPGTPLVDATIPGDAVGVAEATITATLLKPGWYWQGGVVQNAATTQPTVRTLTTLTPGYPLLATTAGGVINNGYIGMSNGSAVSGALPTFNVTGAGPNTSGGPRLFVRLA